MMIDPLELPPDPDELPATRDDLDALWAVFRHQPASSRPVATFASADEANEYRQRNRLYGQILTVGAWRRLRVRHRRRQKNGGRA
jgi:hypothetical protein